MDDGRSASTKHTLITWTMVNGKPVPLDADGIPFETRKFNPEKVQWKVTAYLPKKRIHYR